jgi:alginate O-acetyltransferase complex protein AlgI
MSCFPQLIAGPIVRYSEISNEISIRQSNLESIYRGIYIFSLGLASKVILADSAGTIADKIFSKDPITLSELLSI